MPSKAKGTAKRSAKRSKAVVKPKRGEADVRKLLHELEVRQTELRLQNDELLLARAQTEVALQRYSELFDWAPVGCARLDALGNIQRSTMLARKFSGASGFSFSRGGFRRSSSPRTSRPSTFFGRVAPASGSSSAARSRWMSRAARAWCA